MRRWYNQFYLSKEEQENQLETLDWWLTAMSTLNEKNERILVCNENNFTSVYYFLMNEREKKRMIHIQHNLVATSFVWRKVEKKKRAHINLLSTVTIESIRARQPHSDGLLLFDIEPYRRCLFVRCQWTTLLNPIVEHHQSPSSRPILRRCAHSVKTCQEKFNRLISPRVIVERSIIVQSFVNSGCRKSSSRATTTITVRVIRVSRPN